MSITYNPMKHVTRTQFAKVLNTNNAGVYRHEQNNPHFPQPIELPRNASNKEKYIYNRKEVKKYLDFINPVKIRQKCTQKIEQYNKSCSLCKSTNLYYPDPQQFNRFITPRPYSTMKQCRDCGCIQ